jgi:hypothetical protein
MGFGAFPGKGGRLLYAVALKDFSLKRLWNGDTVSISASIDGGKAFFFAHG